jgi:hypothetical protein
VRTHVVERESDKDPPPRIQVPADPWSSSSTVDETWEVNYDIDATQTEIWETDED